MLNLENYTSERRAERTNIRQGVLPTPVPFPKMSSSRKLPLLPRPEGQREKLIFPEPSGQGHLGEDGSRQVYLVAIEETQPGPKTLSKRWK